MTNSCIAVLLAVSVLGTTVPAPLQAAVLITVAAQQLQS
jgi:hypothetical protein